MKTVFRIFGVLALLIALLTCSMSVYRAGLDKEKLAAKQTEMADAQAKLASFKAEVEKMSGASKTEMEQQIAQAEQELSEVPAESTYLILQIFLSALLLSALAFGVLLFRPKLKPTIQLLAVAVILCAVCYFISPDLKRGEYGGFESKTLALLSGIPVIVAGLFSLLVAKRTATAQ